MIGITIIYNYSKLKGLIKERGFTQKDVAVATILNLSSFNQKLCGKHGFTQNEIHRICRFLNISTNDVGIYFFAH